MANDSTAFDWVDLDRDETVVWSGKQHRYCLVPTLLVGVPLCFVLVGIPIVVGAYLDRENTDYLITTDALYVKRGVLSRDVTRVGLEKVQDTAYEQDFLGTKFGYGSVEISTASGAGAELTFRKVPDPLAVQRRINTHIRESRGGSERAEKAAVLDDILAELRAIRGALETDERGGDAPGGRRDDTRSAVDGASVDDRSPELPDEEP